MSNRFDAPIGISLKTGNLISLSAKQRVKHVLVAGATGTGKTTLMKAMIAHAIKHEYPIVVIDPKGDDGLYSELKPFIDTLAGARDRLRYFSLGNPGQSAKYNCLRRGTAMSKKDRLMASFRWSNAFYEDQVAKYLTRMLPVLEFLNKPVSIPMLNDVSLSQEALTRIGAELTIAIKGGVPGAKEMHAHFKTACEIKRDNLTGLEAQLSALDNAEFGQLLAPAPDDPYQIDFREVIEKRQIVFFQLNVLNYKDTAKRLGRLVLEDLKATSAEVFSKRIAAPELFPVFVDEFGSFATEEFPEFLKLVRGACFSLNLFFQGPEDLEVISKELCTQILNNPITKIVFRQDDKAGVDRWASMAGTMDATERSFQVQRTYLGTTLTGLGNQRETKQMLVEHDVFKNLRPGQAVLIDKENRVVDLIQTWNPNMTVSLQ